MRKQTAKGFTLLELMTALAILAILLSVGVPSFVQMIRNNRITAQANEMVSALNYARSESVKRGIPVSVCSSTDGATCAASTTWNTGWIVFTDGNGANGTVNPAMPVESGDQVLQVWPAVQGGLVLDSVAPTPRNFVQYTSTGMPNPVGTTNFSLYKSGAPANTARCISVSTSGRVSTAQLACP
jgi:type IV fimbrial biogenesis protein FimT